MGNMDISLKEMMAIDGALGAVVVDYNSGMALGALGGSKDLDLQVAAAGNTEVVKAKMRTMESLRPQGRHRGHPHHARRPVSRDPAARRQERQGSLPLSRARP